jgi:N-methylhydantoinase B
MKSDPVTLNVMTSAFHSIAEEMGVNLLLTARSTIIREARDCSCALLDAEGRIVAEAEHIPVQMSSLSLPMRACLAKHSTISPDEVFVTNDPFLGGQHLQDITFFSPIFHDGELLGFSASIAHHVDIGGGNAGLTLTAREFYEEGLRFSALKLHRERDFAKGGVFYDLVHSNFRAPRTTWGDIQAQLAANEVGRRRVIELSSRFGAHTVAFYMAASMDHSERLMRAEIGRIPPGRYEAEDFIDDSIGSDEPIPIRVALIVGADEIDVDLTGSAPQLREFLNVPFGSTCSSAFSAIKMALAAGRPPIPANDGCYRPIRIHAPIGTILNPTAPSATRARMCGAYRVFDAILLALQQALPDRVGGLGFHVNTTVGLTRRAGSSYSIFIEDIGGGWGGTPIGDGADMLDAPLSNCRITPAEVVELDHPFIRVSRYELIPDSGGAGRFRGGLGSLREFEVLEDGVEFFGYSDRHRQAPRGAAGGGQGTPGAFEIIRGNEVVRLPSKTACPLRAGDRVRILAGGGGGFGPPSERSRDAIAGDLKAGKLTRAVAERLYAQSHGLQG